MATLSGWARRGCPLGAVSLSARPGHSVRGLALKLQNVEVTGKCARVGGSPVTANKVLLFELPGGAADAALTEP